MSGRRTPVLRHLSRESARTFPQAVLRLTLGRNSTGANNLGWTLFAVGVLILAGQLLKGVDPQDEGQFLTYPWLIAQGRVPYRDIWMSYPPATYLILVPFFKVGFSGIVVERAFGILSRILYVLVTNRILTGSWRRCSWIGIPLTFSLMFIASDVKPYPWLVAMPLFIVGLAVSRERPIVSALLFFLAGTVRFEFGVGGLIALGALAGLDRARWRDYVAASAALIAAVAVVYAALDLVTNGYALRDILLDQVVTVQRGRYLSLQSLPFGPLGLPVLLGLLIGPPLMVLAGLRLRSPDVMATNLAVLALMPHFFQRADTSHLFSMSALAIPWVVISLVVLSGERELGSDRGQRAVPERGSSRRLNPVVTAAALSWIGVTIGAWCSILVLAYAIYLSPLSPISSIPPWQLGGRVVSGQHTVLAANDSEARDDRQVARYIARHGTVRQRIYITPASSSSYYTRTDLYYVLGLAPAGRYLEVQPNLESQPAVQREIVRNLQTSTWVILLQGGQWYSPAVGWQSLDDPVIRFVHAHFHRVMQNPTYAILKRNSALALASSSAG